jgi:hypothetical protein
MVETKQCLNLLRRRIEEKEYQRRVTLSNLRDAAFMERTSPPSQRFIYRHRREELQQGLAALQVDLDNLRRQQQQIEAEVSGRRLARLALLESLRPNGAFEVQLTARRERFLLHPGFALLKAEYEAALEDRDSAAERVRQLEIEIAELEG